MFAHTTSSGKSGDHHGISCTLSTFSIWNDRRSSTIRRRRCKSMRKLYDRISDMRWSEMPASNHLSVELSIRNRRVFTYKHSDALPYISYLENVMSIGQICANIVQIVESIAAWWWFLDCNRWCVVDCKCDIEHVNWCGRGGDRWQRFVPRFNNTHIHRD